MERKLYENDMERMITFRSIVYRECLSVDLFFSVVYLLTYANWMKGRRTRGKRCLALDKLFLKFDTQIKEISI